MVKSFFSNSLSNPFIIAIATISTVKPIATPKKAKREITVIKG
jgi:hypothetical protein